MSEQRTSAAAVSAALRRGGLSPVPSELHHRRDGLYVSRGHNTSYVVVQASVLGSDVRECRLIHAATQILRAAGYTVAADADETRHVHRVTVTR